MDVVLNRQDSETTAQSPDLDCSFAPRTIFDPLGIGIHMGLLAKPGGTFIATVGLSATAATMAGG
jgi:hypothetical protein